MVAVITRKRVMGKGQSVPATMAGIARDCYSGAMNSPGERNQETVLSSEIPGLNEPQLEQGEGAETEASQVAIWPVRRRVRLPVILFLITALSTFWAGACHFAPDHYLFSGTSMREVLLVGWADGLIYMLAVIAILLSHEMGHFLATVYYRIPASYPMFLPFPLSPIGTLGAVIGMDGKQADRKEIFDIGIAGPLAGLVVAIPLLCIGIQQLDLTAATARGPWALEMPLLIQKLLSVFEPEGFHYWSGAGENSITFGQLNPLFMAGWVGLLITGLNMLPVSQLDGGHVVHTLAGRWGRWLSRGFMVFAVAYVVYSENYKLIIMLALVLLLGTDHPPTRDDSVKLGWFRTVLGLACLLIPIYCLAPEIIIFRD